LAKTVKGYGLGEAGEGRNVTHQQKKLNERELREFRTRFDIPLPDEEVVEAPFYRPPLDSPETQYLLERRKQLRGFVPQRRVRTKPLGLPGDADYAELLKGSGEHSMSTTMAAVRLLSKLLRNEDFGRHIVPIIPDEARTFGMDSLFRQVGIYSPKGQLYEPVDRETLLFYNEAKDGQILEEGITEAGSMSSFIAAGTAYANLGVDMVPFYFYYSMFGFQRIGDLIWAAADSKAKGFLLGATAGRTTLNGEGLQHQDGHSHLLASTVPTLFTYDAAFGYEIAHIIRDGLRRLYAEGEEYFYYLTLYNESYNMPVMPPGVEEGILKGLYRFKPASKGKKFKAHILGSGPLLREALRAQELLAEQFDVSADVWSATSYKLLRGDALRIKRWNMLHPTAAPKKSYLESVLQDEEGAFVAVSDYMKMVPDQIAPWVPGGLLSLGTDGFGRSDTRINLRRFFEVDAEMTTVATLYALYQKGLLPAQAVEEAIKKLGIDAEKSFPFYL
ncbi:MAG TPA: pyruvate dehydrogenase (acetyl-transferring), homodimeric type, partial [Verrucomicrobiae bacterium]|nr:pyruvate dehydrogenase (acetyl-transferring), homodimeric type [Verrucomicrobiae bacterium]